MEQGSNLRLSFAPADPEKDIPYIKHCGLSAWYAVYGRTDDFSPERFWEHTGGIFSAHRDNIQLAMDGEKHAGILIIDSRRTDEPSVAHISLLFLEPDYRGRGLGVQMLDRAVELARFRGLSTVRLYVASTNKRAIRLYSRYGFTRAVTPFSRFSRQYTMRLRLN